MQKQIFIQDKYNKDTYHSLTEVVRIVKAGTGIYDLYFRNNSSVRVSQYFQGVNILDIVELVTIDG
jgi:hypothetical protein